VTARKWPFLLVLLTVALAAAFFSVQQIDDPDLFWHLATGKLIFSEGVPTVNTFSFTYPGYPWKTTEWLFDALVYQVFQGTGFTGLTAFTALVVAGTFLVAADTARVLTGTFTPLAFLPLLMTLHFSRFRFTPRPHLFTFLFLAVLVNLWHRRRSRWTAALVPLTAVLWANLHAGVVLGSALVLGLTGGRLLNFLIFRSDDRSEGELREALHFCLLFLPFTLVNRSFAYPYRYALRHLSVNEVIQVKEFAAATFDKHETFFIFAALLGLGLALLPRRQLLPALFATVPFFILSLKAVRIIPKFGMVALPFMFQILSRLDAKFPEARRLLRPAAAALFLAPVLVFGYRDFGIDRPIAGFLKEKFPVGAADFVQRAGLPGEFFNDFGQGGYLIYRLFPGKRVFVDGRVPYYPASFFQEIVDASRSREDFEALLTRYRVNGAIVENKHGGGTGRLLDPAAWSLVYFDGPSAVYLRRTPANEGQIRSYQFSLLRPGMSRQEVERAAGRFPEQFLKEAARIDPDSGLGPNELATFADAFRLLGRLDAARRFLRVGAERFPSALEFQYNLAVIEEMAGNSAQARSYLEDILRRTRDAKVRETAAAMLRSLR
jgi:hypothetical protein